MKQIATVELISIHKLDVFMWLRKNMNLTIKEAKDLSENGKIIDFEGEFEKAVEFYNYLISCATNSARLIIDNSFDNSGVIGAFVLSDNIIEEYNKYENEFNSK